MSSLTVRLDPNDRRLMVDEIARKLVDELKPHLAKASPVPGEEKRTIGCGVRVLSASQLAEMRNVTVRHLRRLELSGDLPRRRLLSKRLAIYLEHEVEGVPVEAIRSRRRRKLSPQQLAEKLGVHPRTITRSHKLPPPDEDGMWSEREIDDWLISLPAC